LSTSPPQIPRFWEFGEAGRGRDHGKLIAQWWTTDGKADKRMGADFLVFERYHSPDIYAKMRLTLILF